MSADTKLSIPIKLLLEGIGHTITVEMQNGESYRGELTDAESNMNIQMSAVLHTARNGQKRKLESIYVRGSHVKLIIFPGILKDATIFRKVQDAKSKSDKKQTTQQQNSGNSNKKKGKGPNNNNK